MGADGNEIFAVYDAMNLVVGTATRREVHARGLYHRAVHVVVFDAKGALLVQRRSANKDVCPNLWDLSVGEHLQPGETYQQGAARGLREELGIRDVALQRLRPPRLQRFAAPEKNILDCEFVELWQTQYDGPIAPSADEVSETQHAEVGALHSALQRRPELYTPWLRDELLFLVGSQNS